MFLLWLRWRLAKRPKDTCSICGTQLYLTLRYKVRLYPRIRPYRKVAFKELVVCSRCLRRVLNDKELKGMFKVRYRKMRVLKGYY